MSPPQCHPLTVFHDCVTGREFFVGLSKRTNQRGAEILADTFKVGKDNLCQAQNDCLINIHKSIESVCISMSWALRSNSGYLYVCQKF